MKKGFYKLLEKEQFKNRRVIVGSIFSGKTYVFLRIHSRMSDRGVNTFTESPPKQDSKSNIRTEEKRKNQTSLRVRKQCYKS